MILSASGIDTLVLFGIATSRVVLSTLLEASDADHRLIVIEDCCADLDSALHSLPRRKALPKPSHRGDRERILPRCVDGAIASAVRIGRREGVAVYSDTREILRPRPGGAP